MSWIITTSRSFHYSVNNCNCRPSVKWVKHRVEFLHFLSSFWFLESQFSSVSDEDSRLDQCSVGSRNFRSKSFKERNSFSERVLAVENIKQKFPSKVPVIVERFKKVNECSKVWCHLLIETVEYFRRNLCPVLTRWSTWCLRSSLWVSCPPSLDWEHQLVYVYCFV